VEQRHEDDRDALASFEHERQWVIAPDVRSRRIGDETVILDLGTEQYFGLSGVGSRLWDLLGQGTDISGAVDRLAAEYEVDAALVRTDVEDLLRSLIGSELVVAAPEPGGMR
jgi:hypothetical protein